jgi:hypothetical protein
VFDMSLDCKSVDGLCLSAEDLDQNSRTLLYKFHDTLQTVSALKQCGETLQNPKIKILDLLEITGFENTYHANHQVVKTVIKEVYNHPKYGVEIYDVNGGKLVDDSILDSGNLNSFVIADSLLIPEPSYEHPKCKYHKMRNQLKSTIITNLKWLLNSILKYVMVILTSPMALNKTWKMALSGLIVSFVSYQIIKRRFVLRNEHDKQVQEFVDLIVDSVENLAASSNSERPVNHIRDQIIDINDRIKLSKTWQEAIEFIRSNESRISFSQKEVNGQFQEVCSWTDSTNKSGENLAFSINWKGAAANLGNSFPILEKSPQNCVALKIRDFYQRVSEISSTPKQLMLLHEIMGQVNLLNNFNNRKLFKNAKEEKIWPLHYGFEENAAYLRFASEDDAVKFYNCMNAQWYNGRLITPKFVTDSKYFKRFPSAKKSIYKK